MVITGIRPLKYATQLTKGEHSDRGSYVLIDKKKYGTHTYYTANSEFVVWRDEEGQWRCNINGAFHFAAYCRQEKPAIIDAFSEIGMEAARFQYRREVLEALEQLYETL